MYLDPTSFVHSYELSLPLPVPLSRCTVKVYDFQSIFYYLPTILFSTHLPFSALMSQMTICPLAPVLFYLPSCSRSIHKLNAQLLIYGAQGPAKRKSLVCDLFQSKGKWYRTNPVTQLQHQYKLIKLGIIFIALLSERSWISFNSL